MLVATFLALTMPQAAMGMHHDTACPATPAALPPGMEGWGRPTAARAGSGVATATPVRLGAAIAATLVPAASVTLAVTPAKPGGPTSQGGVFAFDITTPGRYRVALGSPAWVDVVRGTTSVTSVAHSHGPACSTVRKMVDFDLVPGRYVLQIAGSETSTVSLMVSRMP